jgi:hypothetical protein
MKLNHVIYKYSDVDSSYFNMYDMGYEDLVWTLMNQCQPALGYIFAHLPPIGLAAAMTEQRA